MASSRTSRPEVRRHGGGTTGPVSVSLCLPGLPAAAARRHRPGAPRHQPPPGGAQRAAAPALPRLPRPTAGPRRHPPTRARHRRQPQHHPPGLTRVGTAGRAGGPDPPPRGRAPAGRKKQADLLPALEGLLRDAVAGDPITGLKWNHKSTRRLSKALRRLGFAASPNTVARLLRGRGLRLRCCRKRLGEAGPRARDRQVRCLVRLRRLYLARGWTVISVDTKKKELVGPFRNPGRCWRRRPRPVFAHDFPSWADGQAIPYGIYDLAHDAGYVVVGTSHDTPKFAVAAIRRWWRAVGRRRYPRARRLLIEADSGGSNDYRKWESKVELQGLADEAGLVIVVTHLPPGASKWNPVDHRMFSLISANWAGAPLTSYEVVLKYLRATRSEAGFRCRAWLDRRDYPPARRVEPQERARVRLRRRKVLPQWNYVIRPHNRPDKGSTYS